MQDEKKIDSEQFSKEQMAVFRASAVRQIKEDGVCLEMRCYDCRGSFIYNSGVGCCENGWRRGVSGYLPDSVAVASCKAFLKDNPVVEKEQTMTERDVKQIQQESKELVEALNWMKNEIEYKAPLSDTWWYDEAETVLDMIKRILAKHS